MEYFDYQGQKTNGGDGSWLLHPNVYNGYVGSPLVMPSKNELDKL
jgi:hypothetical protein